MRWWYLYYSTKMKIGSYIGLGICLGIFIYWAIYILNSISESIGDADFLLFIAIPALSILAALASMAFMESGLIHITKNSGGFRSKMNYCYSCGTSLQEATTAEICPKCNSKLKLQDVIDV